MSLYKKRVAVRYETERPKRRGRVLESARAFRNLSNGVI